MAVELHSDPNVEEKIELELLLRRLATPPRCYSEIAAEFFLTFTKPHRAAAAIVRVTPHRNGVDKVELSK